MDLGPGKGWHCGIVGIAKVPAQRPPRQMHSNGIWEAFPGVLGEMQRSQPSRVSWEAVGWAVVSPSRLGAGFQPRTDLSFSQEESQTSQEVSVPSWHWSCGLPCARGWWCQGKEREGGVDLPYNKCSLEETGREWLLSQWMRKLRPGTEKSLVQVTSWEEIMAQLGGSWSGPDLCLLCLFP